MPHSDMDSYKGYYEYPPSQAAIQHALPLNSVGSAAGSAKAKRSWGNILRIPGRSKKERENSPSHSYSHQAAIYSPPFNLPQSHNYPPQNYVLQNASYLPSAQYRGEPIKTYYANNRENYKNYNSTYSRGSNPVSSVASPPRSNGKNTVRYTDWFGSVVGKKTPVRQPIPAFINSPPLKPETGVQAFQSWDNYVAIQTPPTAIEIPALIPLQNHNICMCPDQIYSTRSKKKKKKCKNCGRKYGTVKNATAIGSYTRIRPAIPPNFYKVPVNAPWAWTPPSKPIYSHPLPAITQGHPDEDEDEDSSPPTPETVRSISGRSSESNVTITGTQENPYSSRLIKSAPVSSVPKTQKNAHLKDDKRISIISSSRRSAYDLLVAKEKTTPQLSSDTDELSDNAVDESWENLDDHNTRNVVDRRNYGKKHNENRVSVISIGENDQSIYVKNNETDVNISKLDANKVKIYNNSPTKIMVENNNTQSVNKISNGYHSNDSGQSGEPETENSYSKKSWGRKPADRSPAEMSDAHTSDFHNGTSSHYNRKSKLSNREKVQRTKSSSTENKSPDRDSTKVVSIAGQRILLDKASKKSSKTFTKYNQTFKRNGSSKSDIHTPEISDWDSLQEFVGTVNFEAPSDDRGSNLDSPNSTNSICNFSKNRLNNNDFKKLIISSDVRDVIHEEQEEEEEESQVQRTKPNGVELRAKQNGTCLENFYEPPENLDENEQKVSQESYMDLSPQTENRTFDSQDQTNGYQPTLSELLQVKSILKRPNSLDTSSETDSDFYFQSSSDCKQNVRKKKSVQFRPSENMNLVEIEEVASEKKTFRDEKNNDSEGFGPNDSSCSCSEARIDYGENGASELFDQNWDPHEEKDLGVDETNDFENRRRNSDEANRGHKTSEAATPNHRDRNSSIQTSEGRGSLRRTSSHRQTVDVSVPAFSDTYRLRQQPPRPSVLFFDDSARERKPTRKAPPPPKMATSPLRPTVPPPPPPLPPPTNGSSSSENPLEGENDDAISSLSSTSLSPPPSPPPPLPSSPPPLPSSSPPPLEDYPDENPSSNLVGFSSSFGDSKSSVSFSARNQQIHLPPDVQPFHDFKERPPPSGGSSSAFSPDSADRSPATIKGRIKASRPNLNGSSGAKSEPRLAGSFVGRTQNKNRIRDPYQRNSFLSSMVEEGDGEERFSDHIYEELPSLPSSPSGSLPNIQEKSIFDGASKYEILEFLQDARNRVNSAVEEGDDLNVIGSVSNELASLGLDDEDDQTGADGQDDLLSCRYTDGRSSNRSSNSESSSETSGLLRSDKEKLSVAEIERTDSGVGSETSKPLVSLRRATKGFQASSGSSSSSSAGGLLRERNLPPCDDCDSPVETKVTNSGLMYAPLVCRRCSRRRQERKEILTEIMETEIKYGRDLKVMMDQFCRPMRIAGLLSRDHLERIFLNIDDLIEHNRQFSLQLKDAFEIAVDQGDEDLLTVNVAKLFLQASQMLHAFQNYCVRQGAASILLQNLEKERELLRIFLKVSQMENTLLRRMNLHSFLMVPVQRVTKYPLLLARLYKATPPSHPSREDCRRAREKIELYLQHINNETKEMSPTKLWRRISMSVGSSSTPKGLSTHPLEYDTTLKLRKIVLEVLGWRDDEACVVREGRLLCLPPESSNWTRRGRALKMATVQMVLATHGRPKFTLEERVPEDGLVTPCDLGIKEAAILAFKDHRLTKTALIREPWLLSQAVLTWDGEGETECFEVTDLSCPRDTYIFKDRECVGTEEWFRSIQFHALSVGSWRRRRPALANIMINGANRPS